MGMQFMPRVGEVLEGRYRIEGRIASGSQAQVFKATHLGLGRFVAVKIIEVERLSASDLARRYERFRREARILSSLHDPRTVTIFDSGQLSGGQQFMVFEYVDGMNLKTLAQEHGPQPAHRVAAIVYQVLLSLQEAHTIGVMHRDIKPSNIMIFDFAGRRDQVKVLDFGIAKGLIGQLKEPSLTGAGLLVGTPSYIPPEVLKGGDYSPESDMYGLGLVAHELLLGQQIIDGGSLYEVYQRILSAGDHVLPELPGLDGPTRAVFERMTRAAPHERFQRAEDAIRALHDAMRARLMRHGAPQNQGEYAHALTDMQQSPPPTTTPTPTPTPMLEEADDATSEWTREDGIGDVITHAQHIMSVEDDDLIIEASNPDFEAQHATMIPTEEEEEEVEDATMTFAIDELRTIVSEDNIYAEGRDEDDGLSTQRVVMDEELLNAFANPSPTDNRSTRPDTVVTPRPTDSTTPDKRTGEDH